MTKYSVGKLIFKSPFASSLVGFIKEKQGMGRKYICEASNLHTFDQFVIEQGFSSQIITKKIFNEWTAKRIYERDKTCENRRNVFKQFCQYIIRNGGVAYLPGTMKRCKKDKAYRPYIFTNSELEQFLNSVHIIKGSKKRKTVFMMLFSLLICTGMRVGEALKLERKDIINKGKNAVIIIRNAKFDKDRMIPLAENLTLQLMEYLQCLELLFPNSSCVFPACHGKAYSTHEVYIVFRKVLRQAGISHGGPGKGPRVHDFRHTYAVKTLRKLVLEGANIMAVIPFLCQYLGHKNTASTQIYLQFTADMFPHVMSAIESSFGEVIPELELK